MNYDGMIYRPPSEAYSLILQVTVGCAHNHCTFCTMYKEKSFHVKPLREVEEDLKEARSYYGNRSLRIFLADGDALVLSQEKLCTILRLCRQYFPKTERITSYGTAQDILRKSKEELQELHELGLDMIYLGAESGSPEILEHIHKGVTVEEYVRAAERLRGTGIRLSVTLISGLGGQKMLEEHAVASAKLITAMKPDYLGFLTLLLEPGAPMLQEVKAGTMQFLTPAQVLEEMELFLTHVDSEGTVFRSNHASNYISLAGNLNRDIPAMLEKILKLSEERKVQLSGIYDIRDESDRTGLRAVIELKRDVDPMAILSVLYKYSDLQITFGVNMVAIAEGRPVQMGVKAMLTYYIEHQKRVVTRRTKYELEQAQAREHILAGLMVAVNHLDEVIALIRKSKSPKEAKEQLIARFGLTDIQAQAILDMRLQRLTGLEIEALRREYAAIL